MDARKAVALVMAKMALSDGTVSDEERGFLAPMLDGQPLDALLEEAERVSVAEVAKQVDLYADRFFIALRAATMAAIDSEIDARETHLYEALIAALEIQEQDQAVIADSISKLDALEPSDPNPRIRELYEQSSFSN